MLCLELLELRSQLLYAVMQWTEFRLVHTILTTNLFHDQLGIIPYLNLGALLLRIDF